MAVPRKGVMGAPYVKGAVQPRGDATPLGPGSEAIRLPLALLLFLEEIPIIM